ncbi:MAG: hypothetical protein KKA73_07800 [Chloroflexi bacterium]|nr:hypothetical protein [Chloroflexota bacterium]MBU1747576.1 hypothetical protein [Chloroflexota bacterium]
MKKNCRTCGYLQPAPRHETYQDTYGWCYAPLPAYLEERIPLIHKKEVRGRTCPVWIPRFGYPTVAWLRSRLRRSRPPVRWSIQAAYVVSGHETHMGPTTRLEVAVVVAPVRGKNALQLNERSHSSADRPPIIWHIRPVELVFYYPDAPELAAYLVGRPEVGIPPAIPLAGS